MISYNYECDFHLQNESKYSGWIAETLEAESKKQGEIAYIFCDDEYLYKINQQYLNHDTYTDIISFDYTLGNEVSGDIFISIDRVIENADTFGVSVQEELRRVMIHGILHYCGYSDKSPSDAQRMRELEEFYMQRFTES